MTDTENKITMSETELAAFVTAQIVKHEDAKEREAEAARTPVVQRGEPEIHLPPRDPEREIAFLKILDENNGDVAKAVDAIYFRVAKHPDDQLSEHLERWSRDPVTGDRLYVRNIFGVADSSVERQTFAKHLTHLDQMRKHPASERLAEMMRLEQGTRQNATYWAEARRPSDLTVEELEALLKAKRAEATTV
jgi:hypothetical protein